MATYDRYDVVRVPFPFTDRQGQKIRPALVLSDRGAFNTPSGHSVLAMITSAAHSPWPLDVEIPDHIAAGLPVPSLLRFKLFTLDHRLIRGKLGQLSEKDRVKVARAVRKLL